MVVLIAWCLVLFVVLICYIYRYFSVIGCDKCYYPKRKCQCGHNCVNPKGHAPWPWTWTQDGWVRKCKFCDKIEHGGDDYDGGPNNDGHMVSDR